MKNNDIIKDTYNILEEIGRGSGGTVFKAYHNRLHKIVVLKKINNPKRSAMRNRQEVDILKNLNHTYLPQVLDFFETDEGIFTVMSYIPGKSLKQLAEEGRKFSRSELLKWGMQLCSALNYLHTRKIPIVHGDIKPSNIMLKPDGDICLIDFNISFFLDENTVLGYTDGYTSPEQYMAFSAKRKRENSRIVINDKADIYSVGATLYYLATGLKRSDFNRTVNMEKLTEALGRPFAEVVRKAVESEPAARYQSAAEMFQALRDIPKNDERYRSLLKRQKLVIGGLCAAALLFAGISCYGFVLMQDQKYKEYDRIVDQQIAYMEEGDFAGAEDMFEEARDLISSEPEAYYQNAYGMYLQGDYAGSVEFIENDVLGSGDVRQKGRRMVDIYALEGLSYVEMDMAAEAVEKYEEAMEFGAFDAENYRDYAIALAYDRQYDKAQKMLRESENMGLSAGSAAYTGGEIHFAKGEYGEALNDFTECLATQDDPYMSMRAYLMINKIYRQEGDLNASREILTRAVSELPVQQQMVVLEELVQTDIDLSDATGQDRYSREAKDYLNRIIDNNWAGYSDYDTLAILCQKQGDLSGAKDALATMEDLYGNDHNIQKRYAFIEIDEQELKPQELRDYGDFYRYYSNALQMYETGVKGNETDQEMLLLEDAYRQLQSGGWL